MDPFHLEGSFEVALKSKISTPVAARTLKAERWIPIAAFLHEPTLHPEPQTPKPLSP